MRFTPHTLTLALSVGLWITIAAACGGTDSATENADPATTSSADGDPAQGAQSASGIEDSPEAQSTDDDPAPLVNQCTPEENDHIFTLSLESIMELCTNECMLSGSTDIAGCVGECFAQESGVGEDCAGCFGNMALCVLDKCADFCPFDVEACNTCAADECAGDMQTCTGVNTGPAPALTCINQDDQQKIETGAIEAMQPCLAGCVDSDDPSDCFGTCASDQELSIDCSGCYADLGTCVTQQCAAECTSETFTGEGCTDCAVERCGPAFQGCTGIALSAPEADETPVVEGTCDSSADAEALAAQEGLFADCVVTCSAEDAEEGCLSACIESAGVSGGCAACLAPVQACLDGACAGCLVDDDDPACGQCLAESCAAEIGACFAGTCTICPAAPSECSSEADAAILASMQEEVGQCTATCIEAADPLSCSSACLAETGLSEQCSGCMAELSVCTVSRCGASCNPNARSQDGGVACQQCLAGECLEETFACFGEEGGPGLPPATDAADCVNATDNALLESESNPKGVCEAACKDAEEGASCLTECLEQAGFTEACSSCVSVLSACVQTKCGPVCNSADTQEQCEGCVSSLCGPEQDACFEQAGSGSDGLCGGASDESILAANPDMVPTCLTDCMSDPSTADTCLSTCFSDLGLSGECSDCVSWMLGCTMTECQSECAGSADPEACNSCSASKCGDEMAACYGEMDGGSGPGAGSFSGEGLCMNPEDGEVMQSNPYMNSSCAQQCFSADDQAYCVGECLFTKGLSEDCAFCMGDLVACSTEYCLTECMGAGPECQECTNVACPEITEACFEP